MRLTTWLLAGVTCLSSAAGAAAQEMDVDLELVLAVDVSRSMDPSEQDLQKQGYIAALQHPDVLAAIRAGFLGRIAVTYAEWAGPGSHRIVAPWTLIDGPESAAGFASRIASDRFPSCTALRFRAHCSSRRACSRRACSAARVR